MEFETGDIVTVGKGKTEWEIFHTFGGVSHLKSRNSGIKKVVADKNLTHVARFLEAKELDKARTEDEESNATASALAAGTLSVPGLDDQGDSVPATEEAPQAGVGASGSEGVTTEEIRQNTRTQKGIAARKPGPEHIPGETPAEYKARTGKKLDGRTTSYGRAILAALQPKLWGQRRRVKGPKTNTFIQK